MSKFALFTVRKESYSVPSRLVGHRLKVRLYGEQLEAWLGESCVFEAARLVRRGENRARLID